MANIDVCKMVFFGGKGDLALRMLLPAMYFLNLEKLLAEHIQIVCTSRSAISTQDYLKVVQPRLKQQVGDYYQEDTWQNLADRITYVSADATVAEDYQALKEVINPDQCQEIIYYLATSPDLFGDICRQLQQAGLVSDQCRVVLEKPLGHDLQSSQRINDAVAEVFAEPHVFRIDHYLGKETVQNILALRFGNALFEPLWNNSTIEHVQITVAETVGVEGRWSYYDKSGAMRDMIQNHLLQLLCLIAMEPPSSLEANAVRDEKLKVLRSLRPMKNDTDIRHFTVRGQYTSGAINGESVPGYLQDGEDAIGHSNTETYAAIRADIDNWRWTGVPFYLRTGKRMPFRFSEILIQFKPVPHSIFDNRQRGGLEANQLIIRLQPEENIKLTVMNKVPGLSDWTPLKSVPLNLSLSETFKDKRRHLAYERLLLDIMKNDQTLFMRRDEVEAAWRWADTIIQGWEESGTEPKRYTAGSWGPSAAVAMTERFGHSWNE